MPFAWAALVLNIGLWMMIYQYLVAVMPSDYGINKHPCFCIRKKEKVRNQDFNRQDLEVNNKIFDENDPILLEKLTKKFGNFTAVKDL